MGGRQRLELWKGHWGYPAEVTPLYRAVRAIPLVNFVGLWLSGLGSGGPGPSDSNHTSAGFRLVGEQPGTGKIRTAQELVS